MNTPNLARIRRVPNLREIWENEERNFTPWLADNLDQLGDALGMALELQQIEAPVGGYSLDILATDRNSNRPVIIENQLEIADHAHLGQLLTYAAGFDAGAVVWVTREFRDEHRQALDWLNQRTGEETQFFGVAIELWCIDNSLPAPHFNLVVTPNGWRKEAAARLTGRGDGTVSPRASKYRDFFQVLMDTLREKHRFTNAKRGQPQSYYNFSIGYGWRVTYGVRFTGSETVTVEVYIDSQSKDWNAWLFHALHESKNEIENALDEPLEWDIVENRKACRIAAIGSGSIDADEAELSGVHDWIVQKLLKFRDVFGPRLAELVR